MWKKIKYWVLWIFGVEADPSSNPDCPTCGPDFGDGGCGDEGTCEEIQEAAAQLSARYDYIHTKHKNKPQEPKAKELCAPAGKTDLLINSGNRCNYEGEVKHIQGRTMVCLQCNGCGEGGGDGKVPSTTYSINNLPDGKCMYDGSCQPIDCGYWYIVNRARYLQPIPELQVKGRKYRNRQTQVGARTPSGAVPAGGPTSSSCTPELIYDETGCKVIGIKPVLLARGRMGYWESTELYPETKRCDGTPMYRDDAGKPIRHHKMPNRALEPHYLSRQNGVVSYLDPGNKEWGNTYARFIQIELRNVNLPTKTAKPLNKANPLTVMMMPRTESQKSVRSSGVFINCFKGNIHGEDFAVPKNGLNGPEYFDKHIYYGGNDTHRGGENMDAFAMVFHGPDTEFDRPALDVDTIKFELNMFGKGMQYGSCAEGLKPDSPFQGRENQKGVRAAINLSKYVPASADGAVNKCVKGISYAPANDVLDKGDDFTYPLLALHRESSVYLEAFGPPYRLRRTRNSDMENNGHPGRPTANDGTSDYSLLGSHLWHERPIHDGSAYYGNLKTYIPNQYGGLINATYIDLYPITKQDIDSGIVAVDRGDSYINQHYLVRKGFMSDKIMQDISPALVGGGLPNAGFLGGLLRKIFEDVGLEECATCPESGDPTDPRNGSNQQALRDSDVNGPWDGTGQPPLKTGNDIFFPNLFTYQISYVCESDVNLYYRATGDSKAGEVYYRKLKDLNYDSSFPRDSDPKRGFLTRFHVLSKETPAWRMIARVIINILFTYGVGLYLIIDGMSGTMQTLSQANISFMNFNIGSWIGALLEILVVALGVAWIIGWSRTDVDNRFWDAVLRIDGCWPDITARPGGTGSRWRIRDGRIRQFEDNYWRYNWDYSRQNVIATTLGLPDPYSTCECPKDRTFEILFSNHQNPLSQVDAYRNFKANSFTLIPSHSGPIQGMVRLGNRVFVQTTDGMFSLQTGASEMQTEEGRSVYLQAATVLQVPVEIFGGTQEGRGGTRDFNAGEVTQWGYIYFSEKARTINLFTGNDNIVLGDFGMTKFLDRFLPIKATDRIRDEKTPGGVGYSLGVDNGRGLIHITKRDYKGEEEEFWTLTFDVENRSWVGFQYFTPLVYVWDQFKMYSFKDNEMWRHGKHGEFLTVYGKPVPMIVDFVVRDPETRDSFAFRNQTVDAEFSEWDGAGYYDHKETFFTEIGAHNRFQSSGLLPVVRKEELDSQENIVDDARRLPVKYLHRRRRFSHLFDRVQTNGVRVFSTWDEGIFTNFNTDILQEEKSSNHFVDNYLIVRFVFSGGRNVRVLLKEVITEINREIE